MHLKFLHRNLVLYEIGRCAQGSSNVDSKYIRGSICFYLKTRTMFKDFWSNFFWVLLLFEGFEVCVL